MSLTTSTKAEPTDWTLWALWARVQETGAERVVGWGRRECVMEAMAEESGRGRDVWAVEPDGTKHLPDGTRESPPGEERTVPVPPQIRNSACMVERWMRDNKVRHFENLVLVDDCETHPVRASVIAPPWTPPRPSTGRRGETIDEATARFERLVER